nr:retrovirus-related Pol polyprotein from transposon TNT 1-94 [Tanacetum cinerariifolium]
MIVVKNDKVIVLGMFRINPLKTSRIENFVPNKPVNVSGIDNTAKTRRPQTRSNTKNDKVTSASKSSCIKNKEVKVEEHQRNLLLSKNKKHNKFLGTIRFRNDHVASILGYGDLQWGNILIARVYYVEGLGHNLFSVRQFCNSDLQQNGVVERRNQTLVEAARTMLILSCAPLFLWVESIATTCYTQNCSLIQQRFNKTPYELINVRKLDISFLHVFGALYPKNDRKDIRKHGAKDILFKETYDDYIGGQPSATLRIAHAAPANKNLQTSNASIIIEEYAPTQTNSSSLSPNTPNTSQDANELPKQQHGQQQDNQAPLKPEIVVDNVHNVIFEENTFVNPFVLPSTSVAVSSSLQKTCTCVNLKVSLIMIIQACLQAKEGTIWVKASIEGMAQPTKKHLKDFKRIFRYLWGTINMGLWCMKDFGCELTEVSDGDYAVCQDSFKSTSGGSQFLGEKLVSWSSKKQDYTTLLLAVFLVK